MNYEDFKKEYDKIIKKVNAEMIKSIKSHEEPHSINNNSYSDEYSSFRDNFINNRGDMCKVYFDIFKSIHFSILDSFKIELFSTCSNGSYHLVLPNAFSISNLYNDNLLFIFNNHYDIYQIPNQTKLIVNLNEIKMSSYGQDRQSPIIITQYDSLEISSFCTNFYIFDELAKKYLESVKDEISPKIKRIYDIANKFNIKNIQSFFMEHDLPDFFFLDDKNIEKNNEKIKAIKDLITLVYDVSLGENEFNKDKFKISSSIPLKLERKY